MTSFRRVAFPLCFATILGGALLFSLSAARGQTAAPTSPSSSSASGSSAMSSSGNSAVGGAPAGAVAGAAPSIGAPTFAQTTGVSPSFPIRPSANNVFAVIGGTGNDTYDLQIENLYSLLRERGVPIPNVLHPLSTAKPSFIVERLITLNLTSAPTAGAGGGGSSAGPQASSSGRDAAVGASANAGESVSQSTLTIQAVKRIVDAEISRGTGRLGGSHRTKLTYLSRAIGQIVLEAAAAMEAQQSTAAAASSQRSADINQAGADRARARSDNSATVGGAIANGIQANDLQKEANANQRAANNATASAADAAIERSRYEAQARVYARNADRYTPNIP